MTVPLLDRAGSHDRRRGHRAPADRPDQPGRLRRAARQAQPRRRKDRDYHVSQAGQRQFLNVQIRSLNPPDRVLTF